MLKLWSCARATALLIALSACSHSAEQPLDGRAINAVEAEIKRQIGIYILASEQLPPVIYRKNKQQVALSRREEDYQCGAGNISFEILSVKADLLATNEINFSGSIGLSPSFSGGSVGVSYGQGKDTTNTQELIYNIWFNPVKKQKELNPAFFKRTIQRKDLETAPIASAIINLRDNLIASGLKIDPYTDDIREAQPCHWDWDQSTTKPGGDPGDSMKFAVVVVRDESVGGKLAIELVNLNLSVDSKSTTGNTVTVNFYQAGTLDATPDKPIPRKPRKTGESVPTDRTAAKMNVRSAIARNIRFVSSDNNVVPVQMDVVPSRCRQVCAPPNERSLSCLQCKHIGDARPDFDSLTPDERAPPGRRQSPVR